MAEARDPMIIDEQLMRFVFAGLSMFIAIGALATRSTDEVDWSLLSPTIASIWAWAVFDRFPRVIVYFLSLTTPLVLNIVESDAEVSMFLTVLAIAFLASHEPIKVSASVTAFVILLTFILGMTAIDNFAWPNWCFGFVFAWGAGSVVYSYARSIEELEHARRLVADQAAVHERRRIARDVHDLVGHSLSVVMLHITGARLLVRKDPAEAERALEQAEAAGRESLAEIRRTVGMLRDESDDGQGPMPSPDLSDVASLVDEFLVAGVDVSLDVDGDVQAVEGASSLAGYRIVQEALTNASRHTVGAKVVVAIDVGLQSYDVSVRNTGGTSIDLGKGSGFGLVSMRERAKSVGGLLVAGPTPDGWTVEATLPATATVDL